MDEVKDSDHLIVFADIMGSDGAVRYGTSSDIPGKVLFVNANAFNKESWWGPKGSRTVAHELGHLLGLEHTGGGVFSENYLNLMHFAPPYLFEASDVSGKQFKSIASDSHNGRLNRGVNRDNNGYPLIGSGNGVVFPPRVFPLRRTRN